MESDRGMIQKTIIASFLLNLQPVAIQATDAPVLITCGHAQLIYLSSYINTVKEGGPSLPSSCEREGGGGLQPPYSDAPGTYPAMLLFGILVRCSANGHSFVTLQYIVNYL